MVESETFQPINFGFILHLYHFAWNVASVAHLDHLLQTGERSNIYLLKLKMFYFLQSLTCLLSKTVTKSSQILRWDKKLITWMILLIDIKENMQKTLTRPEVKYEILRMQLHLWCQSSRWSLAWNRLKEVAESSDLLITILSGN